MLYKNNSCCAACLTKGAGAPNHLKNTLAVCSYNNLYFDFDFQQLLLITLINALTAVGALVTLRDFTLSNARRFYSSMGNPLAGKGLTTDFTHLFITKW